jgi:hypothetical protein
MLKKSASGVLASFRSSTLRRSHSEIGALEGLFRSPRSILRANGPHEVRSVPPPDLPSLRPCWTNFLSILRDHAPVMPCMCTLEAFTGLHSFTYPASDLAQPFLTLSLNSSEKSSFLEDCATRGESPQFPNVRSVQMTPHCAMWHSRRFPYPIHTLVGTHLGTDLETLQTSMKVVLCTGI